MDSVRTSIDRKERNTGVYGQTDKKIDRSINKAGQIQTDRKKKIKHK